MERDLRAAAAALVSLALIAGTARQAATQAPAPGAPTSIPERRGAPLPAPDAGDPVLPTLERPLAQRRFTAVDELQADEISVARLLEQTVARPDAAPLGRIADVLLRDGRAEQVLLSPHRVDAPEQRHLTLAFDELRPIHEGRGMMAEPAARAAPAGPLDDAVERASRIIGRDIASRDGALAGQVYDLILGPGHAVETVVVRLAATAEAAETLISVPYAGVERRPGTDLYLFAGEPPDGLVEFRYAQQE